MDHVSMLPDPLQAVPQPLRRRARVGRGAGAQPGARQEGQDDHRPPREQGAAGAADDLG